MKHLDWTLTTPEANLAADEALLEWAEALAGQGQVWECLRFWMSDRPFVVIGYGQQVDREVDLEACRRLGIPVLRRCSGGGTVLQGPGCLNYTLVLRVDPCGPTRSIPTTNRFVLEQHRLALTQALACPPDVITLEGETDLALDNRKFSGNAQRRRRHCLLFHGTFLLEPDLELMSRVLKMPSRQPLYRQGRSHAQFLTRLPLKPDEVQRALIRVWKAEEPGQLPPEAIVSKLIRQRYARWDWTFAPPGRSHGPIETGTSVPSSISPPRI